MSIEYYTASPKKESYLYYVVRCDDKSKELGWLILDSTPWTDFKPGHFSSESYENHRHSGWFKDKDRPNGHHLLAVLNNHDKYTDMRYIKEFLEFMIKSIDNP